MGLINYHSFFHRFTLKCLVRSWLRARVRPFLAAGATAGSGVPGQEDDATRQKRRGRPA
jgi:hypothetical protein